MGLRGARSKIVSTVSSSKKLFLSKSKNVTHQFRLSISSKTIRISAKSLKMAKKYKRPTKLNFNYWIVQVLFRN